MPNRQPQYFELEAIYAQIRGNICAKPQQFRRPRRSPAALAAILIPAPSGVGSGIRHTVVDDIKGCHVFLPSKKSVAQSSAQPSG
jgi:hypothetical protein